MIDIRKGDATKIRMLTCNVIPVPPAPALTNAVSSSAQEQKAVDPEVRHQIDAAGMKFRGAMHKQDAAAAADLYALNALKVVDWAVGTLSGRGPSRKTSQPISHRVPQKSSASQFRCIQSATK